MSEVIISYNDLQETLAPLFYGKTVRVAVTDEIVVISAEKTESKSADKAKSKTINHTARGILKPYINPGIKPYESGAWETEIMSKYGKKM